MENEINNNWEEIKSQEILSEQNSSKASVEVEEFSKISKNESLATREDVVNKTILRWLKRFYLRKLYELGQNINRRNFKKSPTREIIDTLRSTCLSLFGSNSIDENLVHFLLIILRLKPNKKIAFDKQIEEKGYKVASWMYKYSNVKFSELFTIKELKFLFDFMTDNFYDEVLEIEKTIKANQDKYEETIKAYKARFTKMVRLG